MMSLAVFCAVLAAAFLHAAWNAGIKTGTSKQTSMLILTVWQGIAGVLIVVWRPFPAPEVWPWLIASGFVHMFYSFSSPMPMNKAISAGFTRLRVARRR